MIVFYQLKKELKNWFPAFRSKDSGLCLHPIENKRFFQYFIFQTPYSINEICKNEKLADSSSFYTAPLKTEQVKKLTARLQILSRVGLGVCL